MNNTISAKRLSLAMLLVIAGLSAAVGLRGSNAAESNSIRIEAGETLEIGTDTASPRSQFSWILTKDRKFQSAQRTRFFQTRLAEPGTYVLDVSVQDPITSENGYRAFTIVVTEPTGGIPFATGDKSKPLAAMLKTDLPTVSGTAYVQPEGGMLKIDTSGSDGNISTYHIDLDTSVDSDADGNPANDIDNADTLSEKSGGSLYIFMLPQTTERRVKLTVTDINSIEPKTSELPIRFAIAPIASSTSSITQNPNSPVLMQREGAVVRFSAKLDESISAGKELLYEWDFGDRTKSLLYAPTHTYAAPGTYNVGLKIRDISNAEVLYEGVDSVLIDNVPIQGSSSSGGSESSASSSGTTGGDSSVSLKGILQVSFIILLLLGFAVGLYVLFTWIKRKTATGLQKTLEKMEGTIVNKDVVGEAKPVVMKLKKEVTKTEENVKQNEIIVDREKAKAEFKTQERTNETPVAGSGPVPSWLAKAATKPAPASAPTPTAPAPTPAPKAETAAALTPAPPSQEGPAPAWLKPAPAPTSAPAPTQAPTPAPQAKPAPSPTPAPVAAQTPPKAAPQVVSQPKAQQAPTSVPKPEVKPAPVPAPAPNVQVAAAVQPKAPEAPKPQPKPENIPQPPAAPKPVPKPIPQAEPNVEPATKKDDDQPIAIIQADSISK